MRRILSILAAGTIALSACSDDTVGPPSNYVFVVIPDQAELSMTQDDSVVVSAMVVDTISGGHMYAPPLSWTSDDPDVAILERAGDDMWVHATGAGQTQIHVVFNAAKGPVEGTIDVAVDGNPAATFALSSATSSLYPSDADTLRITLQDAEGNDLSLRRITWDNSADSVASVEPLTRVWTTEVSDDSTVVDSVTYYAVVTANDTGSAEITASVEGMEQTIAVTVALRPVSTVKVTPDIAALHVGETATLSATLKAANDETLDGRAVTWTSLVPLVATVDSTGKVTAVGPGQTTIQASSGGKTGSATVYVQ